MSPSAKQACWSTYYLYSLHLTFSVNLSLSLSLKRQLFYIDF